MVGHLIKPVGSSRSGLALFLQPGPFLRTLWLDSLFRASFLIAFVTESRFRRPLCLFHAILFERPANIVAFLDSAFCVPPYVAAVAFVRSDERSLVRCGFLFVAIPKYSCGDWCFGSTIDADEGLSGRYFNAQQTGITIHAAKWMMFDPVLAVAKRISDFSS